MSAVCLYFQVHQPRRLRHYSVFDTAADYFDDTANAAILQKVAQRCYLPTTSLLLSLVEQHGGDFRLSLSLSGTLLESLARFMPAALNGFCELVQTGAVEILGETSHHSLAALYSPKEFAAQVALHRAASEKYLGLTPRVFRNTDLILDNNVVLLAQAAGFSAILGEGWQNVVGRKGPGYLYTAAAAPIRLLLRNFTLSDDVAFRFNRQ
ncbi:MAG: alpha-amylase, partial [Phycisphaerae bacterium]